MNKAIYKLDGIIKENVSQINTLIDEQRNKEVIKSLLYNSPIMLIDLI
jgi:hypothetical protein